MERTPKKTKVFRFAAAVVTFAALVMWSGCQGANKPGGSSQTGNLDGGSTGGGTPPASADKTYTVDDVSFTMKGITAVKDGRVGHDDYNNNKPHKVSLSAYRIGETEVTQELWQAVMGSNPSYFQGSGKKPADEEVQEKRPVENVTWFQSIAFCNELTKKVMGEAECVYYSDAGFNIVYTKENAQKGALPHVKWNKKGFRLPTEAEWEWAAKGGTANKWAGTNEGSKLGEYAWYSSNSDSKTHEVKKKLPNGYGLCDMSGNVWEWCWDRYGSLPDSVPADYAGAASGSNRVNRGGSWGNGAYNAARADRVHCDPSKRDPNFGLRLACRP